MILVTLGMLIPFTQVNSQPVNMVQAVQDAKTSADHNALAKYYEDQASEMQKKAQEHKKRLEKYVKKSSHYGKLAKNLQEHCKRLIINYEQAAVDNISMADAHRQMAEKAGD